MKRILLWFAFFLTAASLTATVQAENKIFWSTGWPKVPMAKGQIEIKGYCELDQGRSITTIVLEYWEPNKKVQKYDLKADGKHQWPLDVNNDWAAVQ